MVKYPRVNYTVLNKNVYVYFEEKKMFTYTVELTILLIIY